MTRVKSSSSRKAKHKKILARAKGYRGSRSKLVRTAKEAVMHAQAYAYAGRRDRKRQKRREWITTINAALKPHRLSYSEFIKALKLKEIILDRKILAKVAKRDISTFNQIVSQATKRTNP